MLNPVPLHQVWWWPINMFLIIWFFVVFPRIFLLPCLSFFLNLFSQSVYWSETFALFRPFCNWNSFVRVLGILNHLFFLVLLLFLMFQLFLITSHQSDIVFRLDRFISPRFFCFLGLICPPFHLNFHGMTINRTKKNINWEKTECAVLILRQQFLFVLSFSVYKKLHYCSWNNLSIQSALLIERVFSDFIKFGHWSMRTFCVCIRNI